MFAAAEAVKAVGWEKVYLIAAVWLVYCYAAAVLVSYMRALEKFRKRVAWIYRNSYADEERKGLGLGSRKDKFNRTGLLWGLIGCCALGAAIATLAIWKFL